MKDLDPKERKDKEEIEELEKLEQDLHDAEMIIRSRCVDVPLSSNVKVTNVEDKEKSDKSDAPK